MFDSMNSLGMHVFFFKQKTAYEMRISDWSSDVCSSDLRIGDHRPPGVQRHDPVRTLPWRVGTDLNGRGSIRQIRPMRSEERRVGKESGSTCRSRWEACH